MEASDFINLEFGIGIWLAEQLCGALGEGVVCHCGYGNGLGSRLTDQFQLISSYDKLGGHCLLKTFSKYKSSKFLLPDNIIGDN